MPKARKNKASRNAFFYFMQHYRDEARRNGKFIGQNELSEAASPSWTQMDKSAREPFEKMAKDSKQSGKIDQSDGGILTSQGLSVSVIIKERERAEWKLAEMKQRIQQYVDEGFLTNTIRQQSFYFMAGVYFCKSSDNFFVPAEIGVTRFNLEHGIVRKYHTFINPGVIPLGYAHEARQLSELEHRLPPPPNARGESNMAKIRHQLVEFIEPDNNFFKTDDIDNKLVIFAKRDQIPMLETFLKQFHDESAKTEKDIEIFHLEELFYVLKRQSQQQGIIGVMTVPSIHISNMLLEKDPYKHNNTLSCKFHDDEDAGQYCALSRVVRWCFTFADYICHELGIAQISGAHFPGALEMVDDKDQLELCMANESRWDLLENKSEKRDDEHNKLEWIDDAPLPTSSGDLQNNATDDNNDGDEEVLVSTSTVQSVNRASAADAERVSYCHDDDRGSKFNNENKGFSQYKGRPY